MNLKYMKVSLFEITYKKKWTFHDILIYWDAPVFGRDATIEICNLRVPKNRNIQKIAFKSA